jgi:hypothetical protein
MELGRSLAIALYFEPHDICMYVRIYVSSNYVQHASSSHCYFSMNDQLQSSTVARCGCGLPLMPPIKILTSLHLWVSCEKSSYFENSLDIFSKFILLHRFSSRFKFNKYYTSKTRTYVSCSQDGVDEVSSLSVNSYRPLGHSYGDSTFLWNILNYLRIHTTSWPRRFESI